MNSRAPGASFSSATHLSAPVALPTKITSANLSRALCAPSRNMFYTQRIHTREQVMAKPSTSIINAVFPWENGPCEQLAWHPPADVYRSPGGWVVKLELAGIRTEDIQLSISGCFLTIQGKRRDLALGDKQQIHLMEIAYNRFERAIELPCDLENSEISTDYRDGMLLIRVEK